MIDLKNGDCIELMKNMNDLSVDFTLTDIPYNEVNRKSNGLRNLDKGDADKLNFNINQFLDEVYRVTKNTICIFCGREQFSDIIKYFNEKHGTTRAVVWEKTNPSPMNGEYVYLTGIEFAVWFKKKGAKTFNAHCKNPVFKYPCGRSKLHPTEKNHALLKDLILDNTNETDIVFDPCCGSGSHLLVASQLNRNAVGIELNPEYFKIARDRLMED